MQKKGTGILQLGPQAEQLFYKKAIRRACIVQPEI